MEGHDAVGAEFWGGGGHGLRGLVELDEQSDACEEDDEGHEEVGVGEDGLGGAAEGHEFLVTKEVVKITTLLSEGMAVNAWCGTEKRRSDVGRSGAVVVLLVVRWGRVSSWSRRRERG
jgi:hypothetical protein